ncbi:BRCA2-interacting transcriptional repressor EMSY [Pseudolycoriella hygida]|uniref:BRCA2-interacting transcriptional repressor EMSY n=1 Tax=Pseudolycoriella hygida TaxID=35572 RepID=A0A9Q0NG73_9DIPT|nr:BRCA2-interacting transcriptional repressor EMSY [Pseudolycoriella hygida]
MWPNLLDLTKDDCRGILRRSELEAYSNVISAFRAQGSLNEKKSKILKELREIFHINEDRHKAEIRRASNDEELCTIAEKVAGPNTDQEWLLEGRRRYPLLPRDPSLHTALSIVANEAIKDVISVAPIADKLKEETCQDLPISSNPVVTEDPHSIVNAKKVEMKLPKSPKKRPIEKELPTLPLHTNTQIQQIYNSHSVSSGRTPTKQRKIQSKRNLSMKGKIPVNKPTHRKKLATVPSVAGGTTEHKPRQKKNQPLKPKTENVLTPLDTVWDNEIIDAATGPPVQIVYTTPNQSFSLQKDDAQNNLITESTPIAWLNNTAPTIQNNRIQPLVKNSTLIMSGSNTTNNVPRRNFGFNIIEDIVLDQLCNIEKSSQVSSSTHLVGDQPSIPLPLPSSNSISAPAGILQPNVIGPTKAPKIQITSQQILSNKIPIIKSLQSKGNVTLIKQDGRMVIKTPTDPTAGLIQKTPKSESKMDQLIKAVSLTNSPNSSTNQNQQNANKISLQKLQLVVPHKGRGATNMVKIFASPQPLQSTPLKEKVVLPVTSKHSDVVSLSGHENVVVLGVCQTDTTSSGGNINVVNSVVDKNTHVITEDTPIDIISSDEIGKFDKQNNVPLKSTQLLKHLKAPVVKKIDARNRPIKVTPKSLKTIVVSDSPDGNDVVSSTDWEMELDHANDTKSQDEEQDNSVDLTTIVEDEQSDPIESYLHRIDDDDTDDIIQYDGKFDFI